MAVILGREEEKYAIRELKEFDNYDEGEIVWKGEADRYKLVQKHKQNYVAFIKNNEIVAMYCIETKQME